MKIKAKIIEMLLDRLDFAHIQRNVRKRGWVTVPRRYAEQAFPEQVKTGWWPL